MILHKSHSKNDIVEIIELLNIPIDDPNDLNKHQLQSKMIKYMSKNKNQLFLPNHMFISTMDNLIEHLENLNQLKINGQSTRANVMKKAKKLIAYANNDYFFFPKSYIDLDEVLEDIEYILPFGNYPSVRKACEKVNNDSKLTKKYFPVVSEKTRIKMREKIEAKQASGGSITFKRAPPGQKFIIRFD